MSDEVQWLRRWADDTDPERDPVSPMEVRTAPPPAFGAVESVHRVVRGPRLLLVAAVVLAVVGVATVTVAAQGGAGDAVVTAEAPTTTETTETTGATEATETIPTVTSPTSVVPPPPTTTAPVPSPGSAARSWVGVGLREAPPFIEGFDYGVRVVRGGEVLAERGVDDFSGDGRERATSWTSFEVSPGPAVIESDLNVGEGTGPAPVDYSDACPVDVEVPVEGGVLLQLDWQTGCLDPLPAADLPPLSPEPTAAAPGPAGSDPAPIQPSGTFDGRESFALFTGRCPFLDHRLDATFTLADGARWAFRSTYCGEIDADNRHHADGDFTFTTADGSTLAGTFRSEAQLPSTGAPYRLRIEQGSGAYAGATGECAIDNHLETLQFGRQRQFGSFSCTLVVGAG